MIGDYPIHGWKYRAYLALNVAIGPIRFVLRLTVGGIMGG